MDLTEKHGRGAIIPGMEPTDHYWFTLGKYLQNNGMKPVHVNPHYVKKSKELDAGPPASYISRFPLIYDHVE